MSSRKGPPDSAAGALRRIVGAQPGGCADCAADVTLREVRPQVFHLQVAHDDGCPMMRRRSA